MVLQNKYKQAASSKHKPGHKGPRTAPPARLQIPDPDEPAQPGDSDDDQPTFSRRALGTNAERYREEETTEELEDEVEIAAALALAEEEAAELAQFREKQLSQKSLLDVPPLDDDDVDSSFDHLLNQSRRTAPTHPSALRPQSAASTSSSTTKKESVEAILQRKQMQEDSQRKAQTEALKKRFNRNTSTSKDPTLDEAFDVDDFLNLTLESNDVAKRNLSKRDESGRKLTTNNSENFLDHVLNF